jgi:hypothetical protein
VLTCGGVAVADELGMGRNRVWGSEGGLEEV